MVVSSISRRERLGDGPGPGRLNTQHQHRDRTRQIMKNACFQKMHSKRTANDKGRTTHCPSTFLGLRGLKTGFCEND
jgi:hypothetical protein